MAAAQGTVHKVAGYEVHVPHAGGAYGTQLVFCSKMLSALASGTHALLESPTGASRAAGFKHQVITAAPELCQAQAPARP